MDDYCCCCLSRFVYYCFRRRPTEWALHFSLNPVTLYLNIVGFWVSVFLYMMCIGPTWSRIVLYKANTFLSVKLLYTGEIYTNFIQSKIKTVTRYIEPKATDIKTRKVEKYNPLELVWKCALARGTFSLHCWELHDNWTIRNISLHEPTCHFFPALSK